MPGHNGVARGSWTRPDQRTYRGAMNTEPTLAPHRSAPASRTPRQNPSFPLPASDLADPATASAGEIEQALAAVTEVSSRLERWRDEVAQHRDRYVVRLWELGWSPAQIASRLGVDAAQVHAALADRRAGASGEERAALERRVSAEFEAEVRAAPGNLFSREPVLAR